MTIAPTIADRATRDRAVAHVRARGAILPTIRELADPALIPAAIAEAAARAEPDDLDPRNLLRVHWFNGPDRRSRAATPASVLLPTAITGVDAPILVLLGDRFPMIHAHKVLPAYACLIPRLVTGRFDPTTDRAVWPSTGNFCRGGVAISRALGCRGVAVLPEGMSRERFDWLYERVERPEDVVVTPGTESNVKEIYDTCKELARDPSNVILNQFSDFSNHLLHYRVTGAAFERAITTLHAQQPDLVPRLFVAASGSAGILGAGDYLKGRFATRTAVVESLECPTMLANGFGEHNIQGIGDKHIPLIHDVMNTDFVVAVSDSVTDRLNVLFNTVVGCEYLQSRRHVSADVMEALPSLGLSSLCNVVAAIKLARYLRLGPDDLVMTVATDGAELYTSERAKATSRYFSSSFSALDAAEVFGEAILGAGVGEVLELSTRDRERIFNLGYFTWVEQQGVELSDFVARRDRPFWASLHASAESWDELIRSFNADAGVGPASATP